MRHQERARSLSSMASGMHGWSRALGGGWAEVVLGPDTGARIAAVVGAAFPGAVVHAVVTDVLGPHEARIETADGRRLTVSVDAAFRLTGCRTTRSHADRLPAAA